MKELSIFVDESGDFDLDSTHSPYYIISMVFHDQTKSITDGINKLERELSKLGYGNQAIHTEPLIRKETPYHELHPNKRREIFSKLFFFANNSDINYKSFLFYKRDYSDVMTLQARMSRAISFYIRENRAFFNDFKKVILYYDNGQTEINKTLNTILATEFSEYEVRRVLPSDYRLFQVADLICTLHLLEEKTRTGNLSRSEKLMFHSARELKKDFIKGIKKKELR